MESDLEDERKLPDERAWGKKKKSFYSTDFVDQDYEGTCPTYNLKNYY